MHQIGAFGGFTIKSLMDLDNIIFSTGSTFTIESWICEADNNGKLKDASSRIEKTRKTSLFWRDR
jgi:hypothetical protein